MSRFSLFASIQAEDRERRARLTHLRNTILQSAGSYRFSGWNRKNLELAVRKRANSTYGIFLLSVVRARQGTISVHLDSREELSLQEFIAHIGESGYPFSFIFIYCATDLLPEIVDIVERGPAISGHVVACHADDQQFLFALACELVNWWNLQSSESVEVSFSQIADCVRGALTNYRKCAPPGAFEFTDVASRHAPRSIAWTGGSRYAWDVDIEKFRQQARKEQLADTIKRIFDCANHPRGQHLLVEERLISSQGLFWLSEIDSQNDVTHWIRDTRLFSEVAPGSYQRAKGPFVKFKASPDYVALQSLLGSLVVIPGGTYSFGSENNRIASEPPANVLTAELPTFRILRFPITGDLWNALVEEPHLLSGSFPATGVTWFEAREYAQGLGRLLEKTFDLPTEYQWEAAARGPNAFNYPWGNSFGEDCANCEMRVGHPTEAGLYSPDGDSPFGCQDMAGNVREWTRSYAGTRGVDWQAHTPLTAQNGRPIDLPADRVVIRGGSYSYDRDCVQAWVRNSQIASRRDGQTGFRVIVEG